MVNTAFRQSENKSEKHFEADFSVESQPQNPEFRNNPENFHQCINF